MKYAHGFCFAVLCCGYTLTDFPIFIRLTSLALWQSNDCPSASKATLMNMDRYFMWIHYERLHNHNKAKHNKTYFVGTGIIVQNKIRARRDYFVLNILHMILFMEPVHIIYTGCFWLNLSWVTKGPKAVFIKILLWNTYNVVCVIHVS